jgi:hypothetical protein
LLGPYVVAILFCSNFSNLDCVTSSTLFSNYMPITT